MTSYTYNQNIPNPPNDPGVDVFTMQTNAQSIGTIIGIDHVGFNTNNGGRHQQVTFSKNQSAPGIPSGCVGDIYANTAVGGQSWPFWQNATSSAVQLAGPTTAAVSGRTFLPGGIILIWNKITSGLNTGNLAVVFPSGGFPNNCFNVFLTPAIDDNSTIRMGLQYTAGNVTLSASGFTTEQTASSHLKALFYFAIGN